MSLMRRAAYAAGMMIRETGQALDRFGCSLQGSYAYKEQRTFTLLFFYLSQLCFSHLNKQSKSISTFF